MGKFKLKNIFKKMFAFESDVDISDDCAMLHRRNIVIKNIIFFSNLIYTGIFALLSFGEPSNWVLTIILFPCTFVVNNTLKKLVMKNPHDMVKQQIASYVCVFYMFLTAILLYLKMNIGSNNPIYSDSSYILIYYSLVVISLYQSPKLIKNISMYLVVIVTVLHFTITYNITKASYASSAIDFVMNFFKSSEFKDILLRTIMLVSFIIVLYAIVCMSNRLQEQRKEELLKRKKVQDDFTNVVVEMFNVTLNGNQITEEEHLQGGLLEMMTRKLSQVMGLAPDNCEEVVNYSTIHLHGKVDLSLEGIEDKDSQFEKLRVQTNIGNIIAKRLELRRKCEDIIRASEEGWSNDLFITKTKEIQNDQASQIVLLCDLYITLRSHRNYKRAFSHAKSIELLNNVYKIYFDANILDRFLRFANDFDNMFSNYKE